jgi:predicted AAA+ superfamily ATPase
VEGRQDVGALWENYLIAERLKQNEYLKRYANSYFWRTKDGLEIDYVEEVNGVLQAYEFKWNINKYWYIYKLWWWWFNNYSIKWLFGCKLYISGYT